jgi:hypothetical protein
MKNENFLRSVSKLGFPLFETEEEIDANKTISELVKRKDIRLWEGFPVILINSNSRGMFNFESINNLFKDRRDRSNFLHLILLSLSLYRYLHLKYLWANDLYNKLLLKDKENIDKLLDYFKKNREIIIGDIRLDPQRIKKTFNRYFKEEELAKEHLVAKYEDFSLEYALSQIFPSKQKELFLKRLRGEKFTKTESEYFSRSVKKKIAALANSDLHRLAQRLLKY